MTEVVKTLEALERALRETCFGMPFANRNRRAKVVLAWDGWRVYCLGGVGPEGLAQAEADQVVRDFLDDVSEIMGRRITSAPPAASGNRGSPASPPAVGG